MIWTSPAGKTYTTLPGSRIFFPHWDVTTAPLPPPPPTATDDAGDRGQMMPQRRRTRAADRARRIHEERQHNAACLAELAKHAAYLAERDKPPPPTTPDIDTSTATDSGPPPF